VQGSDSNFYGMTSEGGATGYGTVFRLSLSGGYTNLHFFPSSPTDGEIPYAGLLQGSDDNFYGTTAYGGTNNYLGFFMGRIVFKLTVPLSPPPYPIKSLESSCQARTSFSR
jgi:uncharacterized repeat protein (TIGR03803 family)